MPDIDKLTALPLSQSLLAFYREKLRDAQQSNEATASRLDQLLPELEHVHKLEQSLASSINTIDAFEHENRDMKALVSELIEENAKLRLGRNLDFDDRLSKQLLSALARHEPYENHASVITSLVTRCESLERLVTDTINDLARERQLVESCSTTNRELAERLEECQKELNHKSASLDSLPTVQDFEYMRTEVAKLHDERLKDRAEYTALQAENESLRRNHRQGTDRRPCHADATHHSTTDDVNLDRDVSKMSTKLKSLEKFALKFMPDDNVHGVPEFFHTIDKTKTRLQDLDERLRRRMLEREQEETCPHGIKARH